MCVLGAVYVSFHFYIQYQALLRDHGCAAYGYDSPVVPGAVSSADALSCDVSGGNGTCANAF
jgi:hypothetical protein